MRAPDGAGSRARRDVLLAVENVSLALRRREGDHRRLVRHPQGRDPRHHRPERRRQDLDAQRHQRLLPPAAGPHHLQGRDARRRCARTRRPRGGIARTFQNVALFKGMIALDNIMAGRTLQDARELLLAAAAPRAGDERGGRASPRRRGHHRLPRDRSISARSRSASCPTACRSASSSAARSRWSRTCCCSTSRWPA